MLTLEYVRKGSSNMNFKFVAFFALIFPLVLTQLALPITVQQGVLENVLQKIRK